MVFLPTHRSAFTSRAAYLKGKTASLFVTNLPEGTTESSLLEAIRQQGYDVASCLLGLGKSTQGIVLARSAEEAGRMVEEGVFYNHETAIIDYRTDVIIFNLI